MSLFTDLEESVHNHHAHGTLTTNATEPARNGYLLTVVCSCGVGFQRWVMPPDAEHDLISWARTN